MAPRKTGETTATKATTSTAKAATARKTATKSTTKSASSSAAACCSSNGKGVSHDKIAQRAFEIWKQNGGSEEENWLQAEKELRTECK